MRASVLNAMLFLAIAQPFPQIPQENPSVSEDSNSLNLDETRSDKEDQDMTTAVNQRLVGISDLSRQPQAVDQTGRTSSAHISPSSSSPFEEISPDGPLASHNVPGSGSAAAAGISLPSGIPTTPNDQNEQETWIIEPGNGQDPETHPEINRSNSDRLYPTPKCLTLTVLCCDSYWLGDWKLGCSTYELNRGLKKCKVKDFIFCCKGIVSLLGYRCQEAYDGWGNPKVPRIPKKAFL